MLCTFPYSGEPNQKTKEDDKQQAEAPLSQEAEEDVETPAGTTEASQVPSKEKEKITVEILEDEGERRPGLTSRKSIGKSNFLF